MTSHLYKRWLLPIFAAAIFAASVPSLAHETLSKDGTLKITALWTRATPAGAKVAGGFFTITNSGTQPDRLIGGTFALAGKVEVHEMAMDNGVMKMRALDNGIEIKPGQTVELKPGGYHMMFIDLTATVKEDDKVTGTLIFERAGTIETYYHTVPIGSVPKAHAH